MMSADLFKARFFLRLRTRLQPLVLQGAVDIRVFGTMSHDDILSALYEFADPDNYVCSGTKIVMDFARPLRFGELWRRLGMETASTQINQMLRKVLLRECIASAPDEVPEDETYVKKLVASIVHRVVRFHERECELVRSTANLRV